MQGPKAISCLPQQNAGCLGWGVSSGPGPRKLGSVFLLVTQPCDPGTTLGTKTSPENPALSLWVGGEGRLLTSQKEGKRELPGGQGVSTETPGDKEVILGTQQ